MTLKSTYKTYPQLSLCSLLLLFLGIFGGVLYYQNTEANQRERLNLYGEAIATSAARQAVNAAMQQDLVGLQAILTETRQFPYVLGTSIHNVENKLLVQSGFSPNQPQEGRRFSYSAPIALHNNIYGYLEVVIDVPRHTQRDYHFFFFWLSSIFVCLFIIWWSIQRQWWAQMKQRMPSAGDLVTAVVEKIPAIPDIPAQEPEVPIQVSVRLSLQITNMERLYQQLNSEAFATVLRRFERQLQGVIGLYTGQKQMLSGDTLLIDFTGEAYYECCFRAVCTAQLLTNLAARNPSPRLQLAAAIHELSEPSSSGKSLLKDFVVQHNNQLRPDRGEILISQRLIDTELLNHLEILGDSGKLLAIKAPYAELVARQEEQIQGHL